MKFLAVVCLLGFVAAPVMAAPAQPTQPSKDPQNPPVTSDFADDDISCSSDYVVKKLAADLDVNDFMYPPGGWQLVKAVPDKSTITTMGTTYQGFVCNASVDATLLHKDKSISPTATGSDSSSYVDRSTEIYYRIDPSDSGEHLYVEIIPRLAALVAR